MMAGLQNLSFHQALLSQLTKKAQQLEVGKSLFWMFYSAFPTEHSLFSGLSETLFQVEKHISTFAESVMLSQ